MILGRRLRRLGLWIGRRHRAAQTQEPSELLICLAFGASDKVFAAEAVAPGVIADDGLKPPQYRNKRH